MGREEEERCTEIGRLDLLAWMPNYILPGMGIGAEGAAEYDWAAFVAEVLMPR